MHWKRQKSLTWVTTIAPRINTNISFDQLDWASARTVLSFAMTSPLPQEPGFSLPSVPDIATGLATSKSWRTNMTICVGTSDGLQKPKDYGKTLRASVNLAQGEQGNETVYIRNT